MVHLVTWAIAMAVFWLLLSGFFQPLLLIFGILSVALVIYVVARMDRVDQEIKSVNIGPKLIQYCVWLTKEIITSSIDVTRLVWGSKDKLDPKLGKIKMADKYERGRVLYANSITLTPGTLTVDVDDDEITVHALRGSSLDELEEGDMERRILQVRGKQK